MKLPNDFAPLVMPNEQPLQRHRTDGCGQSVVIFGHEKKSPAGESGASARSVVRLERIHVGSIYDR
jgi:hypothetical protein